MKYFHIYVECYVFLTLVLSFGKGVKAETQLNCPLHIKNNYVLNLELSESTVLGGYHKDTMEECMAGCCQQEWKLQNIDMEGHCNLVTFYPQADESSINCFMVHCGNNCKFTQQDNFSYAWVNRPKVDAVTPSLSLSINESAASESQPSPSSTITKPTEKMQTSAKVSESPVSSTKSTTKGIIEDETVSKAEEQSPSSESHPVVTQGKTNVSTTPSTANNKASSPADEKAQSTTVMSPEMSKSATTIKPVMKTESLTEANSQSITKSKSTLTTISTTKAATTTQSKSTPKPESTSNTGSTTKFVSATPKLGLPSTSTQSSTTTKPVTTPTQETTPKEEPLSQEKTTSTKPESTSKPQSEKVSLEATSESLTEKGTKTTTMTFASEEITTSVTEAAGSRNAAMFTFETNNFILVLSLVIGVVLVAVVAVVLGKRWYEAYQRRHYNKVDYLINGMYT